MQTTWILKYPNALANLSLLVYMLLTMHEMTHYFLVQKNLPECISSMEKYWERCVNTEGKYFKRDKVDQVLCKL